MFDNIIAPDPNAALIDISEYYVEQKSPAEYSISNYTAVVPNNKYSPYNSSSSYDVEMGNPL